MAEYQLGNPANRIVKYSAVAFPCQNKTNSLKQPDGYYRVIVGAFNAYNHSGFFYPFSQGIKKLYDVGGVIRRRLDNGLCKSEWGHPKLDGLNDEQVLRRIVRIDDDRVCNFIRDITLESAKDETRKDIILVVASIIPLGPFGGFLQQELDIPEVNVAWSIRSFTAPPILLPNGIRAKVVKDVFTYDKVIEPGIPQATMFSTANLIGVECLSDDLFITESMMDRVIKYNYTSGLENDGSVLKMVKTTLGWTKVQVTDIRAIDWV